jgi:hypothetical protein
MRLKRDRRGSSGSGAAQAGATHRQYLLAPPMTDPSCAPTVIPGLSDIPTMIPGPSDDDSTGAEDNFLPLQRAEMMDGRVSRQRCEGDGGALAGGDAKVKERWQAATRR